MGRAIPRYWVVCSLAIGLGLMAWLVWRCHYDPTVRFLPRRAPADWIVYPNAPDITAHDSAHPGSAPVAQFRRAFVLESAVLGASVQVRAFGACSLRINDRPVPIPAGGNWKEPIRIDVPGGLAAGTNRIEVEVSNLAGSPALWLVLDAGSRPVTSDGTWEVTYANGSWQPARRASDPPVLRQGNPMHWPTTPALALQRRLGLHGVFLVAALGLAAAAMSRLRADPDAPGTARSEASSLLVAAVGVGTLWVILLFNNVRLVPAACGFDVQHHLDYVDYVQSHWALPPPQAAWETHQPPLYYVAAAVYLSALGLKAPTAAGILGLRVLSFGVALGQIGLVLACLRRLFPGEWRRPVLGSVLAAFLPAHLYHAHYITNETFFALLVTATFYVSLRTFQCERVEPRWCAALGLVVGATLLSKLTAWIVAPAVGAALGIVLIVQRERQVRVWAGTLGCYVAACLLVSGWFYWRLWAGPEATAGAEPRLSYGVGGWWQEDGFQTAGYYLRFGQTLTHPLYAGFHSLWDGLYSTWWGDGLAGGAVAAADLPPWDPDLLLAGYWLAAAPCLCILIGLAATVRNLVRQPSISNWLLMAIPAGFGLAQIYFSLAAPGPSQVRASFGLMLLLPICLWFASGLDALLCRWRRAGFVMLALSVWWALTSYTTHFVSNRSAAVRLDQAQALLRQGRFAEAAQHAQAGLARDPGKSRLRSILADCWQQTGRVADAAALVRQAVTEHPDDPWARLDLAFDLARDNQLGEAADQVRAALERAPDHPAAARELVSLLARQRRIPEALEACRNALRIRPHDREIQAWFGFLNEGQAPTTLAMPAPR
jgi:tetratricopeptide (TPR) repeat protein